MSLTYSFWSLPPGVREEAEARAKVLRETLQKLRYEIMPRHHPQDIDYWLRTRSQDVIKAVTEAQLANAALIDKTFGMALLAQGYQDTPIGLIVPEEFAGIMPDGNPLDLIPRAVANRVRERLETGSTPLRAWQAGGELLATITQTALSDSSRMAKAVAGLARPRTLYVRMLRPPSCSRCAILAGKRGHWDKPFQRHPGCDCTQVPVPADGDATFEGPAFDAKAFFDSLDEAEQARIFTKAGAEAIREGADPAAVINSISGMSSVEDRFTRAGASNRGRAMRYYVGKDGSLRGRPIFDRLSVPQIIRQTEGDPQRRIAQLYRHGYLRNVAPGQGLGDVFSGRLAGSVLPPIKPPPPRPPTMLGGPSPEPFRYLPRTASALVGDSDMLGWVAQATRPKIPPEVFQTFALPAEAAWAERLWRIRGEQKDKIGLHEWATFVRLAGNGHEVVLLPRGDGVTPDVLLDGVRYEAKTPTGASRNMVNNQIRAGRRQASRLVIDLLRSPRSMAQVMEDLRLSKHRYDGKLIEIIVMPAEGQEVRFAYE
ncbi:MAG: hypothetical protein Q4G50_12705 [Corynebacterium sp.]|uniref:CdiA C-terminal domain-containing protein n=1 Tax=Corynebacterium sp. TaxID=1720 RepID=UPI0026E0DBD7|nr:hypothetical protein [Corynebacterium sp.]MDO5670845.1 hypothetical protein [Corynebacterium sp.]